MFTANIHRPDTLTKQSNQGIVKAIGPDVEHVQIGWYICFEEMRGLNVEDKHGKYHLVNEDDVECRIEIEPEIIPGLWHMDEQGDRFEATTDSIFSCIIAHFESKPRIVQSVKESR
jgi:hypothetical protein